ncbi:hypothetical protein BU046_08125, partial [Staphylococcus simulans]
KEKSLSNEIEKKEEISNQVSELLSNHSNNHLYDINEITDLLEEQIKVDLNIQALRKDVEELNNYYNEMRDSIRTQLKVKLEEFHYKERELFPDLYKHISYVQSSYTNKKTGELPLLEQNKENTKSEIKKLI